MPAMPTMPAMPAMNEPSRQTITHSEEETRQWGRALGARWAAAPRHSRLVLLRGDLGSGKTTLTKGIVAGMGEGAEDDVTSPTFTLVQEYGKAGRVFHVDLYRIGNPAEIESLGLDEVLGHGKGAGATVLVEWGEKFPMEKDTPRVEISLEILSGDERKITLEVFDG